MNIVSEKFKEVISSVFPVILIVAFFSLFINPIEVSLIYEFAFGTFFFIVGLTIFLVGVDIGIIPFGQLTGPAIAKKNNLIFLILFGIILGFTISIAEPSLIVLAKEVSLVTNGGMPTFLLVAIVSLGLAAGMVVGLIRIIYNFSLHYILLILYGIIFILSFFVDKNFFNIAFDASGATTGVLAVPFILALARGITLIKKNAKAASKDSFGLVSIASIGSIISVMIFSLFIKVSSFNLAEFSINNDNSFANALNDSLLSFLPLIIIFLFMNVLMFRLKNNSFRKIMIGMIYSFIGLLFLLYGINSGFMNMGYIIGNDLGLQSRSTLIIFSFLLGFATILAEPAIHVLMNQVEEVTSGYVKKKLVLLSISIGVGLAVMLAVIRIIYPAIDLWQMLLPLYAIALALNFVTPKLFVGIAFDAGGVATGPLTATFILAFMNGIILSVSPNSSLIEGLGMISLVAVVPVIIIQLLGIMFKIKTRKEHLDE
jgi:hypothetical protein